MHRLLTALLVICLSLLESPAMAVQTHGGTEGLAAHQIGHLLFIIGMSYLLYRLRKRHNEEPGWFEFKTFLVLIISWNVLTFSGHWLNETIPTTSFIRAGNNTIAFTIDNALSAIFYLSRLDHLILVPALLFLLFALRKWRVQ